MSRQADEKNNRKKADPPKKGQKPATGLRAFNPTKDEKEAIKANDLALEDILGVLASYAEDGITFSIGYNPTSQAFYAIARMKGEDWKTDPAVSAWHADMSTCLVVLWYALTVRFPHFPEGWDKATEQDYDW